MRIDTRFRHVGPAAAASALILLSGFMLNISGCPVSPVFNTNDSTPANENVNPADDQTAQRISTDCAFCHANIVQKFHGGTHKNVQNECLSCHENARDHLANPTVTPAKVSFALSVCASCHSDQYDTYLADDATKPGHFGGSIVTSKYDEFVNYRYLMGGHGFTRQYGEDRAHAFLLKDHIDTQRRQATTCLQCKSTAVAYYWNERHRGAVQYEKSQPWDAVVQRIRTEQPETVDYGAGCTHCHDPHNGDFRLIRKGVIAAVLERGTDPYSRLHNVIPGSEAELMALMNERGADGKRTQNAMRLAGTLTCAQCHIEYVCGQGADRTTTGEIRDDIPWRKLNDIEDYYQTKFGNQQDWRHSITGLTGVKPQHPETESYWGSAHHMLGMSCADCHMAPAQSAAGKEIKSHWLTSPLKNNTAGCAKCHDDVQADLFALQDATYARALEIESLLNSVLQRIEAANTSGAVPADQLARAKALFMRALTWWEWTVVSENSMGAHNADGTRDQLDQAQSFAEEASALLP
ncbi:MAG: ammonia-forming cytochrome c nitrite reductase subunit c552 [Phycisphaerales bacterium]|nr:ammonia-forming cytochrome c nitrite reductase subunit c552 [Phycisphaerales bacterium]